MPYRATGVSGATQALKLTQTRVYVPLESAKALRDRGVVRQASDYSCGAAALATLLTYSLGDTVDEVTILRPILEPLRKDRGRLRKKEGLSLLDLRGEAQARGYKAEGFRLTPEVLPKLKRPVIVYIKPRDYPHFAVLKGIRADRAYLADPSLGNVRFPIYKFLEMWLDETGKGIVFVVERKDGRWAEDYLLKLPVDGTSQPEILSARQMLNVGDPHARFPQLLK